MSGPPDPSAGRAVNANHIPLGEYAADCPTRTTSFAIWIGPPGDEDGVTGIDGGGLDRSADGVGGAVGGVDGVSVGVGVGVFVGVAVAVEVGGSLAEALAVGDDSAGAGVADGRW